MFRSEEEDRQAVVVGHSGNMCIVCIENHSPGEKNTGYSFYFTTDQSIGGLTMRDRHDIRQEAKVSGSICIYKFKLKQQNWENLAFL